MNNSSLRLRHILFTFLILALLSAGASAVPAAAATRYALVIASGEFPASSPYARFSLTGPHSDARLMISLLMWRFRFRPDHIRVVGLSDSERKEIGLGADSALLPGGIHATYSAIEAGFQWLIDVAQDANDTVVVYYAGHGQRVYNPDPHAPDVNSEALVPYDTDATGAKLVRDTQIKAWLEAMASQSKTVIVDSCFSGDMIRMRGDDDAEGIKGALISRGLPSQGAVHALPGRGKPLEASLPAGTVLMAACGKTQLAWEKHLLGSEDEQRPPIGVGEFTWALYYVLCHMQDDLSYDELRNHVEARLRQRGRSQTPVLLGRNDSSAAIASVKWPSSGLKIPVAQRTAAADILDVGWLSGLRSASALNLASGGRSLSFQELDWFRARVRGATRVADRYLTVQQFP